MKVETTETILELFQLSPECVNCLPTLEVVGKLVYIFEGPVLVDSIT